jgi:tripartite-type tricarboxylate transporter receptor subunit TctC
MLKIQKLPGYLALAAATATGAYAQNYPTKPIFLYIPFAAGGPTDTLGRNLAQVMGKPLKGQIIVENVVGAGGTIAVARAAKAAGTRCCCTTSECRPRPRCTGRSRSIRSRISSTSAKWPTCR